MPDHSSENRSRGNAKDLTDDQALFDLEVPTLWCPFPLLPDVIRGILTRPPQSVRLPTASSPSIVVHPYCFQVFAHAVVRSPRRVPWPGAGSGGFFLAHPAQGFSCNTPEGAGADCSGKPISEKPVSCRHWADIISGELLIEGQGVFRVYFSPRKTRALSRGGRPVQADGLPWSGRQSPALKWLKSRSGWSLTGRMLIPAVRGVLYLGRSWF